MSGTYWAKRGTTRFCFGHLSNTGFINHATFVAMGFMALSNRRKCEAITNLTFPSSRLNSRHTRSGNLLSKRNVLAALHQTTYITSSVNNVAHHDIKIPPSLTRRIRRLLLTRIPLRHTGRPYNTTSHPLSTDGSAVPWKLNLPLSLGGHLRQNPSTAYLPETLYIF